METLQNTRMLDEMRSVLKRAVLAGAAAVLDVRCAGNLKTQLKSGRELVTEADQRSDSAILSVLLDRLPAIDASISFHLEESGVHGSGSAKRVGADPIDGTNHFACGGTMYAVQAHYVEHGVPLIGVLMQPEVYLPLSESRCPIGRIVTAIKGGGARVQRTRFAHGSFRLGPAQPLHFRPSPAPSGYVACVPFTTKMSEAERGVARKVHESGLIASNTGAGSAAANVMMVIFGGQHVYANFGAGEDLDLIPPQVIAIEAGLTVWGSDRLPPVWNVRKQPFIVAPDPETAEQFLSAAGLF